MSAIRHVSNFLAVLYSILVIVSIVGCGGSGSGSKTELPQPLSAQFAIDGLVDLSTMDNVHAMTVDFIDISLTGPVVKTSQLQWA